MSLKSSGLWCDLCRKPILSGEYWHIKVNGVEGHSCEKCKKEYEENKKSNEAPNDQQ